MNNKLYTYLKSYNPNLAGSYFFRSESEFYADNPAEVRNRIIILEIDSNEPPIKGIWWKRD